MRDSRLLSTSLGCVPAVLVQGIEGAELPSASGGTPAGPLGQLGPWRGAQCPLPRRLHLWALDGDTGPQLLRLQRPQAEVSHAASRVCKSPSPGPPRSSSRPWAGSCLGGCASAHVGRTPGRLAAHHVLVLVLLACASALFRLQCALPCRHGALLAPALPPNDVLRLAALLGLPSPGGGLSGSQAHPLCPQGMVSWPHSGHLWPRTLTLQLRRPPCCLLVCPASLSAG